MGRLWTSFLDVLYPPSCYACELPTAVQGLCPACRASTPAPTGPFCPICGLGFASPEESGHPCIACLRHPPLFRRARACAVYRAAERDHPLTRLLHAYKYDRDVTLARPLAELLVERMPFGLHSYDLAVPVPLHAARLRWRGFNQALLLLRPAARVAGIPVDPFCLQRVRNTRPQVQLGEHERRKNVAQAFAVVRADAVRDRRVLLLDDVYTTGATVNECSRALRRAGARHVDVLALARAVPR